MTTPKSTASQDRSRSVFRRVFGSWRTIIVVTLVSLLIWLFAEAQSLTRAAQAVRVDFVDETGERLVRVATDGWTGAAQVTFEGAAAAVDDAKAMLSEGIDIPLGVAGVPGAEGSQQTADLRVALRNLERFQAAGIRVIDVEPATVRIDIEALLTLPDVPVEPELVGVELAAAAEASPATVSVRAPRSVIERLEQRLGGPGVVARLPASVLTELPDGVQVSREATLRLPGELAGARRVGIQPEKAALTFTVQSRTATTQASAPVWVLLPPFEIERWSVMIADDDQLLRNLTVTGPSDVIERIESGDRPLIAAISLSSDELDRGIASKVVEFWDLPEDVVVEGAEEPVEFTIERRTQPSSAGR